MSSSVDVSHLTRLAQVDSASLFTYLVHGAPQTVLELEAQRSGFNWELRVLPGEPEAVEVEYFPYLVVETKIRPDWPGPSHGPVVRPTFLHITLTHFGSKGIEVIGRGYQKKLDYPKAG